MTKSSYSWIDPTFQWCVRLLVDWAAWLGISYEEINVYLFVIALPLVLGLSLALNVTLLIYIKRPGARP